MAVRVCTIEARRVWTDARGSRIYCRIVFCSWGLLERIATMMVGKKPDAPVNPYNNPERLYWLIQTFDKHINRFDSSFSSLNQKATWTLATATGFAAISGFTKSTSIVTALGDGASRTDHVVVLMFVLFVFAYLALLKHVLEVYRPQKVEYPVSPLNIPDLGAPPSRCEDLDDYGEKCWDDVQDRHIKPIELDFLHNTLRGYIDAIVAAYLLNQKMDRHLKSAFSLLPLLAALSLIMWFLA